jgi:recombination protein RecA
MPRKSKAKPRAAKAPRAAKKDTRSLAEKMRDEVRKAFKGDPESATTFEGDGFSAVKEVLPTRIEVLDRHLLGIGGLPYGRIVEISGVEDTGKSSLVNHMIWAAQQDGATASLGDAERKVQPNWVDVFKVNRKDVLLLPANTIEEWLKAVTLNVQKFGKRNKLAFFLDSVATATPQKAVEEDLTDKEIPGAAAAAWSRGLRRLRGALSDSLAVVVLVNQIRSKIGVMYGPTEESSGGRAIKHYASVRLTVGHGPAHKVGKSHVGKWATIRTIKNHLANANHRKAMALLHFEQGWDDPRSTLLFAKANGVVVRSCRSLKEARMGLGWETDPAAPDVVLEGVGEEEKD